MCLRHGNIAKILRALEMLDYRGREFFARRFFAPILHGLIFSRNTLPSRNENIKESHDSPLGKRKFRCPALSWHNFNN